MIILFNQYFKDGTSPTLPINLLSIASYLNHLGVDTKIYEAENDMNVMRVIHKERPSIVGVGCQFTNHYDAVLDIVKTVKKVNPYIKTVIGGNHASSLTSLPPNVDHVIKGEGELAFFDLVTGKINKDIIQYPLIKDLDTLPYIDYSLVDLEKYTTYSPFSMRLPVMNIITSRGCPNDCIYCTVKGVWGRTWRGKSAGRVIREIEILVGMGFREFNILDDSASVNKKRWLDICDGLKPLKIKWTLPNGVAHWTLDNDVLDKMKEAGCYRLTFGIESGNPRIRKFIRKDYELPYSLIRYANWTGMWTMCTNILGFPYETESQMEDTLNFSIKSGVDFAAFFPLDAYPTADIAKYKLDIALAKKMQFIFYKKFIIHRLKTFYTIFKKIRSFEDFCYTMKLTYFGFKMLCRVFYKRTTIGLVFGKKEE